MNLFTKKSMAIVLFLLITTIAFAQNKSVALNMGEVNDELLQAGGWDTTQVNWTIECWVNFAAIPGSGNEAHIIEFWEGGSGCGTQFYLKDAAILTTAGNCYATGLSGETAIETGTWYHLAYVTDADNNLNTIYLNGEEEMSGDADGTVEGVAATVLDSFVIGHFRGIAYDGGWSEVEGYIDEVRVWYKALSQEEVQARMDSAITSADGLEAVYNFDGDDPFVDATGNGHDLWSAGRVDASNISDNAPVLSTPTAIEQHEGVITPKQYSLSQNYPNPFNPTTKIDFTIKKTSRVELSVYNMLGEKVAVLANGKMSAGSYSATFDAANLPNGIYFYKLTADNFTSVKKMILLK